MRPSTSASGRPQSGCDPARARGADARHLRPGARRSRDVGGPPDRPRSPRFAYDSTIYDQGALALYALRERVGEATFRVIETTWLDRYADASASTDDFIALATEVAGVDLSGFLEDWLRGNELPPMPPPRVGRWSLVPDCRPRSTQVASTGVAHRTGRRGAAVCGHARSEPTRGERAVRGVRAASTGILRTRRIGSGLVRARMTSSRRWLWPHRRSMTGSATGCGSALGTGSCCASSTPTRPTAGAREDAEAEQAAVRVEADGTPGAPVGGGQARPAHRAPGHRCRGQGRHHPACHGRLQPAGVPASSGSRRRRPRSCVTTSCGGSTRTLRPRARCPSSTAATTRTCSSCASTGWCPRSVWRDRYRSINEFERTLVEEGTTIVKFFLYIDRDEQRERLQARLDDPNKRWKFSSGDLPERERWDDYIEAFQDAISPTSTDWAPWYLIPANRKWFRNLAVAHVLGETLEALDPQVPGRRAGARRHRHPEVTRARTAGGSRQAHAAGRSPSAAASGRPPPRRVAPPRCVRAPMRL